MTRNQESRFALNPTSLDIRRSTFDRSSGIKLTGNVGELIPFYVDEVLPGDTFKIKTSKVVRLQTLLHPIMDNMYLDTYYFFVPNRLVWDHWKHFCGESQTAWVPQVEYRIPKINIDFDHPHPGVGSLADYMGIPLGVRTSTADGPQHGINALPFRAYAKICNDWFRAEALTDELVIYTGDDDVYIGSTSDSDMYCANGGKVFTACKYHDYFTSALPAPQSGPAVHIPIDSAVLGKPGMIPVGPMSQGTSKGGFDAGLKFKAVGNWEASPTANSSFIPYLNNSNGLTSRDFDMKLGTNASTATLQDFDIQPSNLYADVGGYIGTINDLRIAFQVQKFYEKMSRGRRYIEVLKSQFGVTSPDSRLQRPEYLGGNRIPLNISEVANNAQTESAALGDLGAMSRTNDVHHDFVHSFTEHGYVIGLMVARYDHSYPQGLERHFRRTTAFDYYWPVFANLGEQPILRSEINFTHDESSTTFPDEVFGYQEAWADYRYKPSKIAGELRPEAPQSLASWHLSDYYDQGSASGPFLGDSWIREDKTNVDRTLAVTSDVSAQFLADIYVKNICTRVMPLYSIPGLADHH